MHLEAAEIIGRIPTPYQVEHFVEPMVRGEVFTTIAGGESQGEGDNWNATQTASHVDQVAVGYQIDNVRKSYVTAAGKLVASSFACRVGADTLRPSLRILKPAINRISAIISGVRG